MTNPRNSSLTADFPFGMVLREPQIGDYEY
ncbi:hypothetical protein SAMN05428978_103319 [Nitrosomonas sp. Nm34]|nr:hypothetical protein SAMN05428978_103319 [Nitrosomonas sp. Nm34]